MPKKDEPLATKTVELKKEQSRKLEDQGEAVRRATELAKEQGYRLVSLKQDLGDSWQFEFYP